MLTKEIHRREKPYKARNAVFLEKLHGRFKKYGRIPAPVQFHQVQFHQGGDL
jgi:hypothetical protein